MAQVSNQSVSFRLLLTIFAVTFLASFCVTMYWMRSSTVAQPPTASLSAARPPLAVTPESAAKAVRAELPSGVSKAEAGPKTPPSGAAAPIPAVFAVKTWVDDLNYYRMLAKQRAVVADKDMSHADWLHARYLVKTYGDAIRSGAGLGIKAHVEDSSNKWYTAEGLKAASRSDVAERFAPSAGSPFWAMEFWIRSAFHRISLLNPQLHRVGYGEFCEGGVCAAVLDTPMDAASAAGGPTFSTTPVMFPPNEASIPFASFSREWPNPLTACPGYTAPTGTPTTLQFGPLVAPKFTAKLLSQQGPGAATISVDMCAFGADDYADPDPETEKLAKETLKNFGAVVLIPQRPLQEGVKYKVSVIADDRPYTWSFSIGPSSQLALTTADQLSAPDDGASMKPKLAGSGEGLTGTFSTEIVASTGESTKGGSVAKQATMVTASSRKGRSGSPISLWDGDRLVEPVNAAAATAARHVGPLSGIQVRPASGPSAQGQARDDYRDYQTLRTSAFNEDGLRRICS